MNLKNVTLLTPPEKLFNPHELSFLLVCPTRETKEQFKDIVDLFDKDLVVYLYENIIDIDWLLTVSRIANTIIIDVDNCDPVTTRFISLLMSHPDSYYLTKNKEIPYKLINRRCLDSVDDLTKKIMSDYVDDFDFDDDDEE